ncbi:glycoside hydrolase family 18 protein [Marinimicrobium alkaliphilum]|uniref:glycoside hydrolase family 18 protein n=1 Tax=Marinimicrobium alkaliphilum TaxID=2202654 RepID=UPI000DBA6252|nr:glycoside hydrolase family 18 protein [Marinimicrobium alkaliphilum]
MLKRIFWVLMTVTLAACSGQEDALVAIEEAPADHERVIVGYIFNPDAQVDPDTIAAEKLTHINYAFSNIEDGELVEGFAYDEQNYRQLQTLKARNPDLKILTSVGGWTWSGGFSDMALTGETRQRFIDSALDFVRRHQLDGIDIDWEYPGLPGAGNVHRPEDGVNFTLLLRSLREQLDELEQELERPLLLTIASGGFPRFLEKSDIANWQRYLDFINIMAYDYNFPTDGNRTGHNAPLYAPEGDVMSADQAVRDHLAAGVPPEKLVLGVPFYGRHWVAVDPDSAGLGQVGHTGDFPYGDTGYRNLAENLIDQQGFERHWDPVGQVPWLWHEQERLFVSYDDPESMAIKAQYVRDQGLRGIMFWRYETDHNNELLKAIYAHLIADAPEAHGQINTESLIGTWQLLEETIRFGDEVIVTFDADSREMIKIFNDSHFAFVSKGEDREPFAGLSLTDQEKARAFDNFGAGGGRYTFADGVLTEKIGFMSYPNYEGEQIAFKISFEGDRMIQEGHYPLVRLGLAETDGYLHSVFKRVQ